MYKVKILQLLKIMSFEKSFNVVSIFEYVIMHTYTLLLFLYYGWGHQRHDYVKLEINIQFYAFGRKNKTAGNCVPTWPWHVYNINLTNSTTNNSTTKTEKNS